MKKSIYPLEIILSMNSRLFDNALEGVTEEQSKERISDHSNPFNWMAAHTIWARYLMCLILGKPSDKNPYAGLFENFKPFDPNYKFKTLEEVKAEWKTVTELLNEAMMSVTEEYLSEQCPQRSPIGDSTYGGVFAFLTQHESYDIGQMAYLKKYFTREAMRF